MIFIPFQFVLRRLKALFTCQVSMKHLLRYDLKLWHPVGVVIGRKAVIGRDCVIYSHVVIGRRSIADSDYPVIGDRVILYTGAKIFGKVRIGNDSIIGAGCIICEDVASNIVVTQRQEHHYRHIDADEMG